MPQRTVHPAFEERIVAVPLPPDVVEEGFRRLIRRNRLFGAEFHPGILTKNGARKRFLPAPVPSRKRLLARWLLLFRNLVAPDGFFDLVSTHVRGFDHGENALLVGRDRIVYDTRILDGNEIVGEMTLFFLAAMDRDFGVVEYLRGRRRRIVYVDHIRILAQRPGYASALFRHYDALFRCLRFDQFRLSASLSVGKYYWAKEGFHCLNELQFRRMKDGLRKLVRSRGLPVAETEIDQVRCACEIARLRRDLEIPVYRSRQGYYALDRSAEHEEERVFPLGKAFLLCSTPWDGYRDISAPPRPARARRRGGSLHAA